LKQSVAETPSGATLEEVERKHILNALRASDGVVTAAAIRLGLHRTTLNAMMRFTTTRSYRGRIFIFGASGLGKSLRKLA
jgi:transcriptional regulator with GAF, ATPase, and Fis domain